MLVEAQWSPGSPGQSTPLSFWMENTSPLLSPLLLFQVTFLLPGSFLSGEDPGAGASLLYSPVLGKIHLPGGFTWSACWSPLRLHPWETADRQKNHWGPAKGAEAKGPHGVLAAKGAEPERALQGLLTRVRTFPGQQLLREQPWILKISSSCKVSRQLVGSLKGLCPTSYRRSLVKLPSRGPIVSLFPN